MGRERDSAAFLSTRSLLFLYSAVAAPAYSLNLNHENQDSEIKVTFHFRTLQLKDSSLKLMYEKQFD